MIASGTPESKPEYTCMVGGLLPFVMEPDHYTTQTLLQAHWAVAICLPVIMEAEFLDLLLIPQVHHQADMLSWSDWTAQRQLVGI